MRLIRKGSGLLLVVLLTGCQGEGMGLSELITPKRDVAGAFGYFEHNAYGQINQCLGIEIGKGITREANCDDVIEERKLLERAMWAMWDKALKENEHLTYDIYSPRWRAAIADTYQSQHGKAKQWLQKKIQNSPANIKDNFGPNGRKLDERLMRYRFLELGSAERQLYVNMQAPCEDKDLRNCHGELDILALGEERDLVEGLGLKIKGW